MQLHLVLPLVALLVAPVVASAQQSWDALPPGTRLRLLVPGLSDRRIVGSLETIGGDSLVLLTHEGRVRLRIPVVELAGAVLAVAGLVEAGNGVSGSTDITFSLIGNMMLGVAFGYRFAPTGWVRVP